MKSKEEIFNNALKMTGRIYDYSQYGENDLYRIKDIIHSLDDNHWKSKEWLVDEVRRLVGDEGLLGYTAVVHGGWYGLLAHLLADSFHHVFSTDVDERTEEIGYQIFGEGVDYQLVDMFEFETDKRIDLFACTSVEHVPRKMFCELIAQQRPGTLFALQTNNDFDLVSHINCSKSLADFVEYVKPQLPEQDILYAGQLPNSTFTRYMIIGK